MTYDTCAVSRHGLKDASAASKHKLLIYFEKIVLPEVLLPCINLATLEYFSTTCLIQDIRREKLRCHTPGEILYALASESSLNSRVITMRFRITLLK